MGKTYFPPSSPSSPGEGRGERLQSFCYCFGRRHFNAIFELPWMLFKTNLNAILLFPLSSWVLTVSLQWGVFWITTQGALFAIFTKFLLFTVTHLEMSIICTKQLELFLSSSTGIESQAFTLESTFKQGLTQPVRGVGSLTCEACRWCGQWRARRTAPRVLGTSSSPLLAPEPVAVPWVEFAPRGRGCSLSHFLQLSWEICLCSLQKTQIVSLTWNSLLRSDPLRPRSGLLASWEFESVFQRKLEVTVIKVIWIDFSVSASLFSPVLPHPLNLILSQSCNWAESAIRDERVSLTFLRKS